MSTVLMLRRGSVCYWSRTTAANDNLVGPETAPGESPGDRFALDPLPRRVASQVTLLDFFAGTESSAVHHRHVVLGVETHSVLLLQHG